jgi:hypothetical protein
MSAEVEKFSVYDDRVVQNVPKFKVDKGSLSVTNAPFNAITQNSSQMVFNVNVPSPNVFLDRAVDWTADVLLQTTAIPGGGAGLPDGWVTGTPLLVFGQDVALAPMPLHQMTTTLVATINDANVTLNCSDTINEILRLTDLRKNRQSSTAPRALDRYQSYNDAMGAVNSNLGSYIDAVSSEDVGNGAYYRVDFTDASGNVLPTTGTGSYPVSGGSVYYVNGIPCYSDGTNNTPAPLANLNYPIFIKFRSTEKICLSPFIFSEVHEYETGLYGISNIQFLANLGSAGRVLRNCSNFTGRRVAITNTQFLTNPLTGSAISGARLNCVFLTPPLSLDLPPRSVVPYMEFPRYITSNQTLPADTFSVIQSQNIVLPVIPDMFIIYAKPQTYLDATKCDFHYPIENISINFNNFSGLMNTMTQEQLFHLSVANGLEMDYGAWAGRAFSSSTVTPPANGVAGKIPLVGGMLVIKPSKDFALQDGLAPNVLGNFNFQASITLRNDTGVAIPNVALYVITVNSGFFESQNGSSRILRGILDEKSVLDAPVLPSATTASSLSRMVGAGFFDKLGSVLSKAKEIYSATKPMVSGIKGMLPEGKIKSALGAVGYGMAGAGMAGSAMAGAGKRRGVASRLMEEM